MSYNAKKYVEENFNEEIVINKYLKIMHEKNRIGVVGLGYIGLPLAVELGKHFKVIGYDIDSKEIKNLKKGIDNTNEISQKKIISSKKNFFHQILKI